ncbi:hypothetical protein AM571_PC00176 (plasmid) [Rhizobium etli 8C-3]|uniref:Uncharacterized protein n=2 Tax=Rhizobium TaxID=379 RepID=A0A1L5PCX7_RHIET|nr:hypothetical protein AM571_PC00176 [Rhizobium etli 8C-3]
MSGLAPLEPFAQMRAIYGVGATKSFSMVNRDVYLLVRAKFGADIGALLRRSWGGRRQLMQPWAG